MSPIDLQVFKDIPSRIELNGPTLSFTRNPSPSATICDAGTYTGSTEQIASTYNNLPVRGFLYVPGGKSLSSVGASPVTALRLIDNVNATGINDQYGSYTNYYIWKYTFPNNVASFPNNPLGLELNRPDTHLNNTARVNPLWIDFGSDVSSFQFKINNRVSSADTFAALESNANKGLVNGETAIGSVYFQGSAGSTITMNLSKPTRYVILTASCDGCSSSDFLKIDLTPLGAASSAGSSSSSAVVRNSAVDVVVLYHGTITAQGTTPIQAAETFLTIATNANRLNLRDKIIFSVAYPQDAIPAWIANPSLASAQFPGINLPNLYLGDNLPYAEAALLWVKNSLNAYLTNNRYNKVINRIYTFGHSQGGFLAHKLNTLHQVDGVICNAPGPINLISRCADSEANGDNNISCSRIKAGYGSTTANPNKYDSISLKSYLTGLKSPTLYTQALDDTTGDDNGAPQVSNMQNIMQVGLSTCTNCAPTQFNYYPTGGHDAFVVNPFLQRDIRSFLGSAGPGSVSFSGLATATFPNQTPINPAENSGHLSYKWYEVGVGPLEDSTRVVGSSTTTLTLTNLSSNDSGREFFLRVDYIPSAETGTGKSTGNAVNDPLDSSSSVISINPNISVTQNPSDATAAQTRNVTFTAEGQATDGSPVSYQWQIGCVDAVDGVRTYTPGCSGTQLSVLDIKNETTGQTVTVDFTTVGRYSTFTPGVVYTLTPRGNFSATIRAVGGRGGTEQRGGNTGGLGGFAQGTFTFVQNQAYKLIVAGAGVHSDNTLAQQNPAATASGGGSGSGTFVTTGGGAQGGGYTGLFRTSIAQSNAVLIAGGGGGANRDPGRGDSGGGSTGVGNQTNQGPGRSGGSATQTAGGVGGDGGNSGTALKGGDGVASLYSSGGGGGYFGGGGGGPVGVGGGGSGFIDTSLVSAGSYVTEVSGTFPADFSGGGFNNRNDGNFEIVFGSGGGSSTYTNTVSGARSKTMTISSANVGTQPVRCIISHPTACNSPVITNSATFTTVPARELIRVLTVPQNSTIATIENINLFEREYFFGGDNSYALTLVHAVEKDIDVIVEMRGPAGASNFNGAFVGGQGGISVIRFTMKRNEEYVITGFSQANSADAVYLYRKASLIAVMGGGGNAGSFGNGGDGGGVNVAGGAGSGPGGGNGGVLFAPGTLPPNGVFGSSFGGAAQPPDATAPNPLGGRVLPCPRGNYYKTQGFSPCQELGNVQFRIQDGQIVTNSDVISRGFKAGLGIRQTAGRGLNGGGQGGNGATGGNGGNGGGGGGGGSGYTDGSVTVISTRQGGNTGAGSVRIRLAT